MLGIFLDQETTGLDSRKHNVIELAFKVLHLATGEQVGEYSSVIRIDQKEWENRDPMSMLINNLQWDEIERGASLKDVRREVIELLSSLHIKRGNSVFICQNPSFDRPFFSTVVDCYEQEKIFWPYHWLDLASMFWTLEIKKVDKDHPFLLTEGKLSKDAIASAAKLPPEKKPHRAMQGVNHLIQCYEYFVGFPEKK